MEAVNQAIRKAVITPRFKCLIYDNQYGSEIKALVVSETASSELIKTMIPKMVEDALKPDTRIIKVYDFDIETTGDEARIFFRADTVYGNTSIEEVI